MPTLERCPNQLLNHSARPEERISQSIIPSLNLFTIVNEDFFIEDSQTHFFLLFIKVECTNIGMFYVWYDKVDLAKDLCRNDGILKIIFFIVFIKVEQTNIGM